MKRLVSVLAVVTAGLGMTIAALAGASESTAQSVGPCETDHAGITSAEWELYELVNAWRAANLGRAPMQLSGPANRAAQWFAEAMIAGTTWSHNDQYGRTWVQRLRDCGYDAYWAGGSGEALAGFGSSDPSYGSTPGDALAMITEPIPGHSNGVQANAPWQCVGVGFWSNPDPGVGDLRYAWVVVTAQYGSANCPELVTGPTDETPTPTATATPTATPTPSPTPTPIEYRVIAPHVARDE